MALVARITDGVGHPGHRVVAKEVQGLDGRLDLPPAPPRNINFLAPAADFQEFPGSIPGGIQEVYGVTPFLPEYVSHELDGIAG